MFHTGMIDMLNRFGLICLHLYELEWALLIRDAWPVLLHTFKGVAV